MKVNQNLSIIALDLADIDEEEFLMFYDINKTPNLDLPYWKYERFDLDPLENVECVADFDFKNMIHTIYLVFYKFLMKLWLTMGLWCQTLKLYVFF